MKIFSRLLVLVFAFTPFILKAQKQQTIFQVVPLGVKGGSDESNLSSYAIAVKGTEEYVCLDAGTINYGVQKAIAEKVWSGLPEDIIKAKLKGYLLSHPHLDHLSGLVINSPDDSSKPIYGLPYTIDVFKDKYFSWKSWANFSNEGEQPALSKYHYVILEQEKEIPLENTTMTLKAFSLSHSNTSQSTAFLIGYQNNFILYLGDTGSDEVEKSDKLNKLWRAVGPLVTGKELKAIFIEVSFSNAQPENLLFGHLTPKLLMKELNQLNKIAGAESLKGFPIVITHMKPSGERENIIKMELIQSNSLGLNLVFPTQGTKLEF